MADDVMTDVQPESSPGPEAQPAPGQAPSAPVADAQPQQRTIPLDAHIRERQAWQREKQEYQRQLQEFQASRQSPPTDEERQLKDAREAFYGKVAPELKDVPQLLTGLAQERFVSTGERLIESFATQHGLTSADLSNTLVALIQNDPALLARAQRGDVSLVSQYLKGLEPVVKAMKSQGAQAQRQGAVALGQAKTATQNLPPATNGGLPGEPKSDVADLLNKGDERGARASMHERAIRMAKGLMG